MNTAHIVLNKEQFNRLFPTSILINQNMVVESYGTMLADCFELNKNARFFEIFNIKSSNTSFLDFEILKSYNNKIIEIETKTGVYKSFRGYIDLISFKNQILFTSLSLHGFINNNFIQSPTFLKNSNADNELLSLVASANENGVLFTNNKGQIFWVNEGFKKNTGYSTDECLGKTPIDLCKGPLTDKNKIKEMSLAVELGMSFNIEIVLYRKDKSWFWGRTKGQGIPNSNGTINQYFAIVEDITEKKQKEENLKKDEEKYRSIISNMNLGLLEVDLGENILYANQSFMEMSGYSNDELLGKFAPDLFIQDEFKSLVSEKNKTRKNAISDAYEIKVFTKNKEPKWWLISGAPRYNVEGVLIGSIGIHLDITKHKNVESELITAREHAEQLNKTKESFLANMSHEIRTPMNAIMGMSNQLAKTSLNKQQHFYLNTINSAADNLMVIINDILDLSKIDAGKFSIEKIGFEPRLIVSNALQVMNYKAEEKGLLLINSFCDSKLSPVLIGDPFRLNQVLLNLISNAIKFTEKGTVDLSCRVIVDNPIEQTVQVSVKDTGIGMDESYLKELFNKFSQENETISRKYGGTGLGMSICKEIIELMGGTIYAESVKGQGSSFYFSITFKKGNLKDVPAKENINFSADALFNKKILVTDDNDLNRLVAATILQNYGAIIIEAIDGKEAIDIVNTKQIDLVLMDIQMPNINGLDATKIIRQTNTNIPIIALTANAIKGENEKCFAVGMNDYVTKPFTEEMLVKTIGKWLGKESELNKNTKIKKMDSNQPLYDLSMLNTISQGNKEFVKKMVTLFCDQTPKQISEMVAAYQIKDFDTMSKIAHKIKPSIDNLQINNIKEEIRFIEKKGKENIDDPRLNTYLQKINTVISQVTKQMMEQ